LAGLDPLESNRDMAKRGSGKAAGRALADTGERRIPVQDRGQRRVEEILDAAEAVIVEQGVDAATTNAIAERAQAGVGSLYHFFPNKDAIITALAARYQLELFDLASRMLEPEMATMPIPAMAERIVTPIAEYLHRRPAYLKVYRATSGAGGVLACHDELHRNVVRIVETLMRARSGRQDDEQLNISAMAAVEMVHHLLEFSQTLPPGRREGMVRETIRILALHSEMVSTGRDPLSEGGAG